MSEKNEKYVFRKDYELLFYILSKFSLDTDLYKVVGTAEPDKIADVMILAEEAIRRFEEAGEKHLADIIRKGLREIKMRSAAKLQKMIVENQFNSAELLKMIYMIAGAKPEAVEEKMSMFKKGMMTE